MHVLEIYQCQIYIMQHPCNGHMHSTQILESYSHVKVVMICYFCTAFILVYSTLALSLETVSFSRKNDSDSNQVSRDNSCSSDSQCPAWYFCENTTKTCKCGKTYHRMSGKAYVLNCYCVWYNEESNSIQAGICFYNCETNHRVTMNDNVAITSSQQIR